jgi:hypothetical protein
MPNRAYELKTWSIVLLSSFCAMACFYFYSSDRPLVGSILLALAVLFIWWAQRREATK